jgi:glycosyltransferase involved in cell wall biosynthesis
VVRFLVHLGDSILSSFQSFSNGVNSLLRLETGRSRLGHIGLHILYVVHGYKPAYRFGGPINSVSAVAEEMAARGHRVTVFTTNRNLDQDLDVPTDQPIDVDGVTVWYFRHEDIMRKYFRWSKYLSQSMGYLYTPALRRSMREILPSVDVVHTQMPFIYPTMAAARLAISAYKPLIYNQRGNFHPQRLEYRGLKKRLYMELVEKPIMRRATTLIALTTEEIDSYRALGIKTPCCLVPNGIDVGKFRRAHRPNALTDLGITESARVILFLGRLHPSKGADLLVDSFFRIASSHSDAVLVLAGPDEHGFVQQIRADAFERGLGDRVIVPGMVVGERKVELLARADLFVLPSTGEGQSIAILEALASGTPVIISPECNFSIVEEAGAGMVVKRDAAMVAETISRFLSDPILAESAGECGYALARDKFGWTPIVDALQGIYRSAIGAS